MRNVFLLIFLGLGRLAVACPACLTAEQKFTLASRTWLTGVMGVLPLLVAVAVALQIRRLSRSETKNESKSSDVRQPN